MTPALESVPLRRRKRRQHPRHLFPDEDGWQRLYLLLGTITQRWPLPPRAWQSALNSLAILVDES